MQCITTIYSPDRLFLNWETDDIYFQYNNKYNQNLPHFYVMSKWMANNYFFVIKSIYLAFTC